MNWDPPQRPLEYAEATLVGAILDETFAVGSSLPGERTLAAQLGITRPTLREALRRLEKDGWLQVQHGKATVVSDYWRDGHMNVLTTLVRHAPQLPPGFVDHLLAIRRDLAPSYVAAAIHEQPAAAAALLAAADELEEEAAAFAAYDWRLHHEMSILSGNPVYTLILNGFATLYERLARRYFSTADARGASRRFYRQLAAAAADADDAAARLLVKTAMSDSLARWHKLDISRENLT